MASFWVLVLKEVKDLLRDPHMLIMLLIPALVYSVMGEATGSAIQQAVEQAMNVKVFIVDEDGGVFAELFKSYIARIATVVGNASKADVVLVLPASFSSNLSQGLPAHVVAKVKTEDVSIAPLAIINTVRGAIWSFNNVVASILSEGRINNTSLVSVTAIVILPHKVLPSHIVESIYNAMFTLVLAPLIVAGYAAIISSASIACEKEEKTLETLLTLPVPRTHIVAAKLIASLAAATIGTISIGFGIYWYTIKTLSPATTSPTNLVELLGHQGLASLLAATMALLVLTCIIGLFFGMLCQSIRGAQSLSGLVFMLVFAIGIPLLMTPLPPNPTAKLLTALIPFSAPIIAIKATIIEDTTLLLATLFSHITYTLLLATYITKIVSSEKLLLGIKH